RTSMSVVIEYTQSSHTVGFNTPSPIHYSLGIIYKYFDIHFFHSINKNDILVESKIRNYTLGTFSRKEKTDFITYVDIEKEKPDNKFRYRLFGPSAIGYDHFDSMNHVSMLPLA
ncbi:MAG: hypothetical protein JZD41_06555, partial [Thermoproteus sp.]|nr:hypothetical protein [Thermoproteus sp.]